MLLIIFHLLSISLNCFCRLPADVETNIEYTNQTRQRVEKVQKAVEHLIHKWKGSGMNVQEHIAEPLGILSAKAGTGLVL